MRRAKRGLQTSTMLRMPRKHREAARSRCERYREHRLTADKGARGKRDTGAFETKEKREGTVAVTE